MSRPQSDTSVVNESLPSGFGILETISNYTKANGSSFSVFRKSKAAGVVRAYFSYKRIDIAGDAKYMEALIEIRNSRLYETFDDIDDKSCERIIRFLKENMPATIDVIRVSEMRHKDAHDLSDINSDTFEPANLDDFDYDVSELSVFDMHDQEDTPMSSHEAPETISTRHFDDDDETVSSDSDMFDEEDGIMDYQCFHHEAPEPPSIDEKDDDDETVSSGYYTSDEEDILMRSREAPEPSSIDEKDDDDTGSGQDAFNIDLYDALEAVSQSVHATLTKLITLEVALDDMNGVSR